MDNIYFDKISTKGRAKQQLNDKGKEMIKNLSKIMCTQEEICSVMGTTLEILKNDINNETFMEIFKRGREEGQSSLRRKQFELAMKGNCSMLIWLGKQYLGQTEKIDANVDDSTEKAKLVRDYLGAMKK